MKCLDESPPEIAQRIRSLAEGVGDPRDASEIRDYADWLERRLGAQSALDKRPDAESCD